MWYPMRKLVLLLALAAASPAAAQTNQFEIDNLRMQQQLQQQRSVDQSNQLMALEARQRAEQSSVDANLQRLLPERAPSNPYATQPAKTTAASIARYPSISDATLADSNRRVQDAATKHH